MRGSFVRCVRLRSHPLYIVLLPFMGGSGPVFGRLQGLFPCPGSTAALLPVGAPNASLSPDRDIFVLVCWFTFQGAISFFAKEKSRYIRVMYRPHRQKGRLPPWEVQHLTSYVIGFEKIQRFFDLVIRSILPTRSTALDSTTIPASGRSKKVYAVGA